VGLALLVRHGLTAATGPVLSGWTPGVHLDERGRAQAARLAERLAPIPLAGIVASPLERCQETAAALAAGRDLAVVTDDRLGECRYGDWTGRELRALAKEPLWKVVQSHPSAVTFPGPDGESLAEVSRRSVEAVREWDARFGEHATWVACSHGDVIKAVTADALGLHLDGFQRISVDPCSVTAIRYTPMRPFVVRLNDVGGDPEIYRPPPRSRRRKASSDAPVGGGAG
jgi:probable phosphomutase (TIGR03848 family)